VGFVCRFEDMLRLTGLLFVGVGMAEGDCSQGRYGGVVPGVPGARDVGATRPCLSHLRSAIVAALISLRLIARGTSTSNPPA
jgi:hypothetical protein